jgi:hypothetical protein
MMPDGEGYLVPILSRVQCNRTSSDESVHCRDEIKLVRKVTRFALTRLLS